ncbi:hypothetical protein AZI87_08000 [Bdellovibrio bacteriovorus]|uniref:AMIN domain-containing protein n=1 Tax=Bdellovibrio bacteriovorus TaxID=959 RepID=A0A162GXE0_BDEBC|nr:hypothetical protein [Bdellovibrio bacteriovorus]KYG69151.1 hypothetical protein AZI87_08000 [Bdellovibrio bacteriovorus]
MKFILVTLLLFSQISWAQTSTPKSQSFTDKVYKIENVNEKVRVSFKLHPSIYELTGNEPFMDNLKQSLKLKKPVKFSIDQKTRKIIDVKGP